MSGFDNGENGNVQQTQQAPDFSAAMEQYNKQVTDLSVRIKAAMEALDNLNGQIAQAKSELQAQYNKKVSDLGYDLDVLQAQIADLQKQRESLNSQIQERQDAKDAISLDNSAERSRLDQEWADIHNNSRTLQEADAELAENEASAEADKIQLQQDKKDFENYRAGVMADLSKSAADLETKQAQVTAAENSALSTLQTANAALSTLSTQRNELTVQVAEAQTILATADAVKKQAADVDAQSTIVSAQALRNQQDADQIKVARVALNNLTQELNAREQMISLAEKQQGGK